jgi:hypothetical protein
MDIEFIKENLEIEAKAKGIGKNKEVKIWNTYGTKDEFKKTCELLGYGYINIKGDFFSVYIK